MHNKEGHDDDDDDDGGREVNSEGRTTTWERDIGWHLAAFAPTPLDAFRLHMARVSHDLAPGTIDAERPRYQVPSAVVHRRNQGRRLIFLDVDVLPSRLVRVQVVLERNRVATPWEAATLCDVGGFVVWTGRLGVSLTSAPSIYADTAEVVRMAPEPESVARMAKAFDKGFVTRKQACRALSCDAGKLLQLREVVLRGSGKVRHHVLAAWARRLRGAPARRNRRRKAHVTEAEKAALATAEAMGCCGLWGGSKVVEEDIDDGDEALGRLEPERNLPEGVGWERVRYAYAKKAPQVRWMTSRISKLLGRMSEFPQLSPEGKPSSSRRFNVVDVGGGRGDLALAVAAKLGPIATVTVVDTNSDSLAAGRARAAEEGLLSGMRFIDDDIERVVRDTSSERLPCDLVIGLHACGGLGEYALWLAVERGASFCVCTCCFNSNPHLAVLTRTRSPPPLPIATIKALCMLAEKPTEPPSISQRAMHAMNCVRLGEIQSLFTKLHPDKTLQLRQLMFSSRFSRANCVLVGLVLPKAQ